MPSTPFRKPRHSLEAFDKLFERAFAPRESTVLHPAPPPLVLTDDLRRPIAPSSLSPMSPPSPVTPFYSPVDGSFPISAQPQELSDTSLDPIWEEVMQAKERELAGAPSKVKSLEGAGSHQSQSQTQVQTQTQAKTKTRPVVTKRRSSVNFRESPDGRNMLVTFDMAGVKKQDMHVSYRTSRLVVSWRVERTAERADADGVPVREREVRRYTHTIPLPEGTKFEEVRASRDGQRLTLTLPNSRCVRADGEAEDEPAGSPRTIPDIDAALSGISDYHSF